MKHTLYEVIQSKNEPLKSITILGGGKIDFWSMEDPNSGRGRKYKRVIIDEAEKARNFQEAWGQAIRPTLADLEGDCWILSTPKGKKTFFTQLTEYPKKDKRLFFICPMLFIINSLLSINSRAYL